MKILRFKTFDFQSFKVAYAERCKEVRDLNPITENWLARCNTADFVERGWATQKELDDMPVLVESDAPVLRKEIRMTQSETRLMEKATYLMDEIIYRSAINAKADPEMPLMTSMNASLMKDIVGKDYLPILEAFEDLNYIKIAKTYDIGEAKRYEVICGIEEVDCPREIERKVKEYGQKTTDRLTSERKEGLVQAMLKVLRSTDPEATEETAKMFLKRYVAGLNKIKIADETGLNRAIPKLKAKAEKELNDKGEPKDPESIRIYYEALERTLREDKDIYVIDTQGRMYHFLTGLKRELKDYLTIVFSLDCKNSHPVLFNYVLFVSHEINVPTSYKLSYTLRKLFISLSLSSIDAAPYHYDGKYFRYYLIDNGLDKDILARMEDDELQYIYETTNGVFWDNICREHPEYDRTDIKEKMFAEVFYSNTPKMEYKRGDVEVIKEFGKMFKKRYPNVYKEIARWKQPEYPYIQRYLTENGVIPKKPTAALSISLMTLESRIFTSVLASLYRKRYYAVHIHDCIVIPETGNTHQPTREEVERLLMREYAKYGLVPALKAE